MNSWHEMVLGDVLTLQRGFDITKVQQSEGPYPVVSSSGINSYHSKYTCAAPGVVIGRKGSLGSTFFLDRPFWAHDTTLWVKDFKGNEPRFCYYLLQSLPLASYDVGSSNPTLNRNHLHLLEVRVPEPSAQRRIAGILSAYDDLVDVNTRRIAILEEMSRRLFDEQIASVDTSTPPDGWRTLSLGELVSESRDTILPSEVPGETPYVGLEHMPRRSTTLEHWGRADEVASAKFRFQEGDVLFGKIRPYFHKVVIAPIAGVSSSDAIVMRPIDDGARALAACLASSDRFVAHAVQTSNGTKMPRANWNVLRKFEIAYPPVDILRRFVGAVGPALQLCADLAASNRLLRAARDLLLPKLISGAIHLEFAEHKLEAAE